MPDVWLKKNRRVYLAAMIIPLIMAICGAALRYTANGTAPGLGIFLMAAALLVGGVIAWQALRPRLAFDGEHLLVYPSWRSPTRLPLEVVEVFFLGHQDVSLPAPGIGSSKVATVVIRIAEAAEAWHHRPVPAAFGKWEGGYVVIRGTCCEPLTAEVLRSLNHRLRETKHSPSPIGTTQK